MFFRQPILRTSQRTIFANLRNTQRRLASSEAGFKLPDNKFNRERSAVKAHAAATSDLWRKLSIYVVIPVVGLGSLNAYTLWVEHWEHWSHMPPIEERVEYPYQNIRNKNYFWGDGDKTIFWNPEVNYHNKDKTT